MIKNNQPPTNSTFGNYSDTIVMNNRQLHAHTIVTLLAIDVVYTDYTISLTKKKGGGGITGLA